MLWLTRPASDDGFANGGPTTTIDPVTTTSTSVDIPIAVHEEAVYFFVDQTGDGWQGGPFLVPVAVTVEVPADATTVVARVGLALERLFEGVGDHASDVPVMSSAIPADAEFLGVTRYHAESAIVTVGVSAEFAGGGGSFSMQGRLAQVVYTATAVEGVTGVRFEVDGVPTTVFGGEGVIVDDPATRDEFEAFLPAIMIESPAHLGTAGNPLSVTGTANVFEATVSVALTDAEGLIIWEGFTTATCGTGCRGTWGLSVPYEVAAPQWGHLIVWEASAEDGRQTNVREHMVWLVPGDGTPVTTMPPYSDCSGLRAGRAFADQPDLPQAVAEKRALIWGAAVECDWGGLGSALGTPFSYSFGDQGDPIGYWQRIDAVGGSSIQHLADLLAGPYATVDYADGTTYVWPSAFGRDWADVGPADREALRPLYGDDDFASFDQFGAYIGYRIGIRADGEWVFFVAGD